VIIFEFERIQMIKAMRWYARVRIFQSV
jgi:hypothetical protein